jgi:hypothetical protein
MGQAAIGLAQRPADGGVIDGGYDAIADVSGVENGAAACGTPYDIDAIEEGGLELALRPLETAHREAGGVEGEEMEDW